MNLFSGCVGFRLVTGAPSDIIGGLTRGTEVTRLSKVAPLVLIDKYHCLCSTIEGLDLEGNRTVENILF